MPLRAETKVLPVIDGVSVGEAVKAEEKLKVQEKNIIIQRHTFTRSRFNLNNEFSHPEKNLKEQVGGLASKLCPRNRNIWKRKVLSWFPFIEIMKGYGRSDLFNDVVAGLTVGVMHIPQGMAYGFLANIDPVYGLYTTFFSIFVYFFFGTSRHISIGVFAVISLMIGNVVDKADCTYYLPTENVTNQLIIQPTNHSTNPPSFTSSNNLSQATTHSSNTSSPPSSEALLEECKVQHALAATFIVGLIQLLMGVLKIGFLTTYLSEPLTRAFTTGAAIHVLSSQLKHVFGVNPQKFNGPFKIIYLYKSLAKEMANVNLATLVTSVVCMLIIYCMQRWASPAVKKHIKVPIPSELIVMVVGTLLSHYCHLSRAEGFNIKVLGSIPQGIPPPRLPDFRLLPEVALDAVAMAIVTFTINISMATMFSTKHSYKLHSNQELVAYGMTNMVCSCFNCYVSAASLSRSLVQESSGGKTQVAGLISSALLLVVLLFVGPLFHDLPNCILAAVIIVNLKGIFMQVVDLTYLSRISKSDALTWLVTCLSVILLDVDLGLICGLAFSFFTIVIRNQVPKVEVLGHIKGSEIYVNMEHYHNASEIPGVQIFSLSSSLFFANSDKFTNTLKTLIDQFNIDTNHTDNSTDNKVLSHCNNDSANVIINNPIDKSYTKTVNMIGNRSLDHAPQTSASDNTPSTHPLISQTLLVSEPSNHHQASSSLSQSDSSLKQPRDSPGKDPGSITMATRVHHVIVDCSKVPFVDVAGICALDSVNRLLSSRGIALYLASCNREVYEMLLKAMVLKKLAVFPIFVTLHDAVVFATST